MNTTLRGDNLLQVRLSLAGKAMQAIILREEAGPCSKEYYARVARVAAKHADALVSALVTNVDWD